MIVLRGESRIRVWPSTTCQVLHVAGLVQAFNVDPTKSIEIEEDAVLLRHGTGRS